MKTLYKTPEIEYLHYVIQIINHAIIIKDLRAVVVTEPIKPIEDDEDENKQSPFTYIDFLKNHIEKTNEVISISKLHQRVVR